MADHKKEQEREELHRTIWAIANDLRGSVDGWDFKQYVLGMLFYRYISENFTDYINQGEQEAGNEGFDYALLPDEDAEQAREDLITTKGFFILPSQLFSNVRARAPQDENLNETLAAVFQAIEDSAKGSESEDDFKGLFDDIDVNSNKLGPTVAKRNEKLVKLLSAVGDGEKLMANTQFGSCVFANKPGDGSAREQAASCQKVLGGFANICYEFATKRYRSNCINWGILPFTLDADTSFDYAPGDCVFVPGIRQAIENGIEDIPARVIRTDGAVEDLMLHVKGLTDDEKEIILDGCLMNYYAKRN